MLSLLLCRYVCYTCVIDRFGLIIISRLSTLSATKTLHWKHICKFCPISLLLLSSYVPPLSAVCKRVNDSFLQLEPHGQVEIHILINIPNTGSCVYLCPWSGLLHFMYCTVHCICLISFMSVLALHC